MSETNNANYKVLRPKCEIVYLGVALSVNILHCNLQQANKK